MSLSPEENLTVHRPHARGFRSGLRGHAHEATDPRQSVCPSAAGSATASLCEFLREAHDLPSAKPTLLTPTHLSSFLILRCDADGPMCPLCLCREHSHSKCKRYSIAGTFFVE